MMIDRSISAVMADDRIVSIECRDGQVMIEDVDGTMHAGPPAFARIFDRATRETPQGLRHIRRSGFRPTRRAGGGVFGE